jgi:hypothetical protein
MTGRDLIIYILQNNLENEEIFANGKFIGFITVEEAAVKFDVGVETVKIWVDLGYLSGIKSGGEIYILANAKLTVPLQE